MHITRTLILSGLALLAGSALAPRALAAEQPAAAGKKTAAQKPGPQAARTAAQLAARKAALAKRLAEARQNDVKPFVENTSKAGIDFFERHIRPVLVNQCYECHSSRAKEVKGGLALDTREGIRKGGNTGPAVVPGSIEDSVLIEALKFDGLEMPPQEQLPNETIARFEEWVRMGAPDPRDGKAAQPRTIDLKAAREFWAFKPVRPVTIPAVKNSSWPQTDIDRFILARLEERQLQPAADASPHALARRISFDLTGLPPTLEQLDAFVNAAGPQGESLGLAAEKLVDELLATPQFGERWGRHWLDVVRFGESTGMERDATYPYAWKFRDYVIQSFNEDKPWDQFIREQVAGDQLTARNAADRRENLIATGLLALGPKSLNENNREQFAMDVVDDQIDVTTRAFLAITASCARCHDHKFDPIPTSDYYALAGIFRSSETFYGTIVTQGNRQVGRLLAFANGDAHPVGQAGTGKQPKPKQAGDNSEELRRSLRQAQQKLDRARDLLAKNPDDPKLKKALQRGSAEVERLTEELAAAKKSGPRGSEESSSGDGKDQGELLMAVLDRNAPADTAIRLRGEPDDLGAVVPRGFLTVLSRGPAPKLEDQSGRLALANWLADEHNPLTARVAVNRFWAHLFGRGLVETVDNFGETGTRPSHPELLDHLAAEFVRNGWSVKKSIRSMMLSRAYRLGGFPDEKAELADAENILLWRASHRRLEVEAIRDAILMVSGRLDLTPPTGSAVEQIGDGIIGQGGFARGFSAESTRRSVYLPIIRSTVPEILRLFDFPEPSMVAGQREVTTVATQALFLMNSRFVIDQSAALATRLLSDSADDAARIDRLWRLTLSRAPTDEERAAALKFVTETTDSLSGEKSGRETAWAGLVQSVMCSAEFRYVE